MAKITKKELALLADLNEQRAATQTKLVERAKTLLEIWTQHHGLITDFCTAELAKDGASVAVTFTWSDVPYQDYGARTEQFPIDWFLNSTWADETLAALAAKKAASEEKAAKIASLKSQLAALEGDK